MKVSADLVARETKSPVFARVFALNGISVSFFKQSYIRFKYRKLLADL
jgi:hypothetical protein